MSARARVASSHNSHRSYPHYYLVFGGEKTDAGRIQIAYDRYIEATAKLDLKAMPPNERVFWSAIASFIEAAKSRALSVNALTWQYATVLRIASDIWPYIDGPCYNQANAKTLKRCADDDHNAKLVELGLPVHKKQRTVALPDHDAV